MAQADTAAAALGHSPGTLMEAAGRAVVAAVRRRFRPVRAVVLAGPGANGGDGWVAARHLEAAGWPVAVTPLAMPPAGSPAAAAAARWRGPVLPFAPGAAARAGLVVDALFGAGLSRPLAPGVAAVLAAAGGLIVAVDLPSGLDGATGRPLGPVAAAALTVTFFRLKPAHLLLPGRALCGAVALADIGLPPAVLAAIAPLARRLDPRDWRLPPWRTEGHKYDRGHVVVAAGAGMPGAARLAATAARRGGAGLVTLATADPAAAAAARGGEPGLIVSEGDPAALLADRRLDPWVLGPGLPPDAAARALLAAVLGAGRRAVVDAGALTACAGDPGALRGAAILTPHEGEFARLFGPVGGDRPGAARRAAALTGAVVVLKGADVVVAAPDGRIAIGGNAPPWLATAGTGDVLAGLLGALLAQGMVPFDAARAGVWLHGAAAAAGGPGMLAEDVAAALPGAMALPGR